MKRLFFGIITGLLLSASAGLAADREEMFYSEAVSMRRKYLKSASALTEFWCGGNK